MRGEENKNEMIDFKKWDRSESELLYKAASSLGILLDEEQCRSFFTYIELLLSWNKRMNLTSIEDKKEIIIKHFIDSLTILPIITKSFCNTGMYAGTGISNELMNNRTSTEPLKVADVGTGAGFPGIPLCLAWHNNSNQLPDIQIKLIDSTMKKINFLNDIITRLNLSNAEAIWGRAEDLGTAGAKTRGGFDIVTARAVASMPVLLEICLPLLRTGGIFIVMKGSNVDEEGSFSKALDLLGGNLEGRYEFILPYSDFTRNVFIIKKFRQTPLLYPRKSGKPTKLPLK
ncbi:MAG: 16S rRNA (guanine(527)-N(7))-methyltransferase RsmG [Clostridiales bacterium]|nr:16S rRNA (guanine(527)-N(7))-methyltransferase RsmG [Clostridiales bacterium]